MTRADAKGVLSRRLRLAEKVLEISLAVLKTALCRCGKLKLRVLRTSVDETLLACMAAFVAELVRQGELSKILGRRVPQTDPILWA